MNEIIKLCEGYSRLDKTDNLYNLLEPFYINEKTKPIKCATPWKMIHKKTSDVAILALHGYKGYPGEMIYPGLKLYTAGFDVFCPRYPGHGVSKEDFCNTDMNDWLSCARTSIGYLEKDYKEVYVMGHSMGALIATIISKEFYVKKVALIAPAFNIKNLSYLKLKILKLYKNEISISWKGDKSFWGICERDEGDDDYLGKTYWSIINLKQISELTKIKNLALSSLNKLSSDTLCVIGDKDSSVDFMKVEKLLKKKLEKINIEVLKDVNHLCQYFNKKEKRDLCNDTIVNFFLDAE